MVLLLIICEYYNLDFLGSKGYRILYVSCRALKYLVLLLASSRLAARRYLDQRRYLGQFHTLNVRLV